MSDSIQTPQSPQTFTPSTPHNTPQHPIEENSLSDDENVLSPKQRVAIELLAIGRPLSEVAAQCGVNRKTLYVWRHDKPEFLAELKARRRELWGDVADQIRALLPRAVNVLAEQLAVRYDRARVDAAKAILRLANVKSAVPLEEDE